ncbi:hypothetical protein PHISCL_08290 [Aspergillus sclerotialis]|uniref:tRNA-splicing endonuclease subunit Sen15 domain-containing protein n=1 Tax=Aspergillus sclerotialis TaxID=2070753 RepID=A0A3A2ZJ46_9EURO|nr:hypothetical protein PHISCL_08290 [Aspergillus sclerotialis]
MTVSNAAESPPAPSSVSTLISSTPTPATPYSATAAQVLHSLQHQHLWTSLETHPLTIPNSESPIYLISGIPPHRVYTHPDEQLFMLEKGLRDEDIPPERVFALPLAQGQSWSLRRMAAVFDSLSDEDVEPEISEEGEKAQKLTEYYEGRKVARATKEWGGKRMLLAMIDKGMGGDGTVVYYVIQEGAVKPRQN